MDKAYYRLETRSLGARKVPAVDKVPRRGLYMRIVIITANAGITAHIEK